MRRKGGHRPSFRLLLEGLWYESSESRNVYPRDTVEKDEISRFDSRSKIRRRISAGSEPIIRLPAVARRGQGERRTLH